MLEIPRFIEENYDYYNENGIQIKEDAPEWAKEEYKEYLKKINSIEDENGIITEH